MSTLDERADILHGMTSKEALGLLQELREKYFDLLLQGRVAQCRAEQTFLDTTTRALMRLTELIHGRPGPQDSYLPCQRCRVRLASALSRDLFLCAPCGKEVQDGKAQQGHAPEASTHADLSTAPADHPR